MNIYVSTCDNAIYIIEAFQHFFNKYWGEYQHVTILGYKPPEFELARNFSFVSLGKDKGPRVCGELYDFFSGLEDRHLIWTVGDFPLVKPLDAEIYHQLVSLIRDSKHIGRAPLVWNFGEGAPPSVLHEYDDYRLVEQAQDDKYRLSAVWSIWRRKYLLKYLKPGMDLWEWETREHAKNDGWRIIGTEDRYALSTAHLLARGRLHPDSFHSTDKLKVEMSDDEREIVLRIVQRATWRVAGEAIRH